MKNHKKKTLLAVFLTLILTFLVGCDSMSEYEETYNAYEAKFSQMIFSDKNEAAYKSLMEDLRQSIADNNASKCNDIMESLNSLLEASKSYSISYLDKQDENIKAKENGLTLYDDEISKINEYKSSIETAKGEEKYKDALSVYEKYMAFVEAISMSSNYKMEVSQVDVSEYPNVKLYVSIRDVATGESIDELEYENFYISEDIESSGFKKIELAKAVQLDQTENLNIDIVADISASMDVFTSSGDTNMNISKQAMVNFVNQMQFGVGDKAGLVSFADGVTRELYFTDDKNSLVNRINSLPLGNMTSLYDALYASINQIVSENGAKCIIAFTDGEDNVSRVSYEAVKDLAQRYKIPIYIIGIGDGFNGAILEDIATSTGGYYKHISDASYMAGVYDSIFKEQKSQYLLEYETRESSKEAIMRNLYIRYMKGQMMTRVTYSYKPIEWINISKGSAAYNQGGYIFPDSDKSYLTIADLEKLTAKELRLARNEIYARRGRRFNDASLQSYFNGCSWYNGTIAPDDFVDETMMNKYERANAYLILDYENSRR